MSPTNHGKINMLRRIPIVLLVISQANTYLKKKSRKLAMSLFTKWPYQDPYPNMKGLEETEATLQAHSKRKNLSKNLFPNLEHSKRETFPHLSSEDTTIEEICLSESTTKALFQSSSGKSQPRPWTTTTIFLFSLTGWDRKSTLIELLLSLELTTC